MDSELKVMGRVEREIRKLNDPAAEDRVVTWISKRFALKMTIMEVTKGLPQAGNGSGDFSE